MSDVPDVSNEADPSSDAAASEQHKRQVNVEEKKNLLLSAVAAGRFDTLEQRVAWLLNHVPATRDSDHTLQFEYWDAFEGQSGKEYFSRETLRKLQRLTSLARARATIQNTYDLFKASDSVRSKRGTLSDEERKKAREHRPEAPTLTVYMDESGKTGSKLIVGSLWFLFAPGLLTFIRQIDAWKTDRGFRGEFHFNEISRSNLEHYISLVDFLKVQSATMSFKALSVDRPGIRNTDQALRELYYLLLERGIEHEHRTARATLPRELSVWKDQEEESADKLFLEDLRVKLRQASVSQFDGKLSVGDFYPIDSKDQPLVQIADLYTGALNRALNSQGGDHPKDQVAAYFLETFGSPSESSETVQSGDMTVHMSL